MNQSVLVFLKVLALIWGVAFAIVFILDVIWLFGARRRGISVKWRKYLLGTFKLFPMAPFIYVCILDRCIHYMKDCVNRLFRR